MVDEANRMIENGAHILKLNIGNPAPFGFNAPEEIILDMIYNLRDAPGVFGFQRNLFCQKGHHAVLPDEEYPQCGHR